MYSPPTISHAKADKAQSLGCFPKCCHKNGQFSIKLSTKLVDQVVMFASSLIICNFMQQ